MSHRFDGRCIDHTGGGGGGAGSEAIHVAQQSRRDKLRVQAQQLGHDANPNPSHDFIYSSTTVLPSSGILDFSSVAAANDPNSFLTAASCDWIINCVVGNNATASTTNSPSMSYGEYNHNHNHNHNTLQFSLPPSYHNTLLQQVVDPSSSSTPMGNYQGTKMMGLSLPLPPTTSPWADTSAGQLQQYHEFPTTTIPKDDEGFRPPTNHYQNQGLSLSLASNPPPAQLRIDTGFPWSPPARGHVVDIAASVDPRKLTAGPLGPFTGYATILKSSKFLRPAQQLLDEFCSVVTGSRDNYRSGETGHSAGASASCNVSSGLIGGDEGMSISGGRGGNSGVTSSSYYSSTTEGRSSSQGGVVVGVNCDQVRGPEIHQKKVKLLYLQDEVCRRYKQYHQQMQMVVSSFESVAGLSAATPYTSLAVRSASKHFRCIKNAISDQLRQVSKLLGEEFMSSPSSSSRGETMMTPRLKHIEQGLKKHRGNENSSLGFIENNQPVWRPQRGLPERAVAVLRAWLFEHFLHPYPTDTDKHMLATQTGLSRSQVSNWFINARVRLWKPMVEEIHNLESKGMSEMDLNSSNKNDGKSVMNDDPGQPYRDQLSEAQSNKSLDCPLMGPIANESNPINMEQWHREKRTRMEECEIPQSMDDGLMSFAYQGGMDLGGLGAVSLTLGLRHSEDPQQQQQMRHFGSQMLHDFVG